MNALAQKIVDRLSDRLGGSVEKYSATSINRAVKAAASETDANPTDAQKEAGNYRKGRFSWNGMSIAIENPAGSIRSGKSKSGHEWSITMPIHYGYIARTESESDGDAIDVFVGPNPESEIVFVVDQQRGDVGQFDEHKVVIGYSTEQAAREAYLSCYSPGWKGLKSITPMTLRRFKEWISDGDSKTPMADQPDKYAFREEDHPRDEIGRFVDKAASSHAAAKKSAKTVEERRKSYESLVAKRESAGNDDDVSDDEQQAEDQLDLAEAEEEDNRLDAEIAESDAVSAADEAIDALNQEEPELAKELTVAERNHKRLSGIAAKLREKADRLKQAAEAGDGPVTPEVRAAISNHKKLAAVAAKKQDNVDKLKGVVADLEQQKREAETQVESYSGQIDDLNKRQNAAIEKYVSVSRDPDTTDEDVDAAYAAMRQIEKEENELARIINPLESAVEKLGDKIDKAKEVQQEAESDADEADENAAEALAEIADAKRTAAMELFDEADADADDAESEAEDARQELESLRAEHAKTIEQRDELKAMRARLPSMIAERIAALLGSVAEKYSA